MKTLRKMAAFLVIAMILLMGADISIHPMVSEAATVRKVSKKTKKKRSKRYFIRTGFDWDNHYLQVGKKEDLSKYLKGTAGLSRKTRARLIRWKSSKPSVISINRYGIARAKKAGKARIRIRMKTKRGWKTISKTIQAFDSRKVSFTVSLSLSEGNRYAGKVQKSYNVVFDTVTIRVKNSSSKPVTFARDLLVCGPECSYVQAKDRYGVDVWMYREKGSSLNIPSGKTQSVVYKTEGALSYLMEDQKNNNTSLVCVFTSDGVKKNLRYEMPIGKTTVSR